MDANAGQSIEAALAGFGDEVSRFPGTDFFAGISTAFTCPFEGDISPEHLLRVVRAFKGMGITTIGLADTLGTTPTERVISAVGYVLDAEPDLNYSLHLHNAHNQALVTVSAAIDLGITRFDSALGGYGGYPFAPGAAGNLATEECVRHLHAADHDTGIDEAQLAETVAYARQSVTRAPALSAASASH